MKLSLEGEKVGNYVIKSLIGRGGMGAVYLAEHPRIKRKVAIKVLASHLAVQEDMARRFETEAQAMARLLHPNIIEIYDFGSMENGTPYYAMELLKGRELRQVMRDTEDMTEPQVLPYLEQICTALQVAHDHSVVHRDLKPENIFVLEGEPLRLKILDFGIAKMLESMEALALTATGMILGSPVFAAPEQVAGDHEAISVRTDLYSLGVILYWMLCGAPPFSSNSSGMLIAMHIKDPPPPLREKNPRVLEPVARVIHRCLEKDPGDRPASATELLEAYKEALESSRGQQRGMEAVPSVELSGSLAALVSAVEADAQSAPTLHEEVASQPGQDVPDPFFNEAADATVVADASPVLPAALDQQPTATVPDTPEPLTEELVPAALKQTQQGFDDEPAPPVTPGEPGGMVPWGPGSTRDDRRTVRFEPVSGKGDQPGRRDRSTVKFTEGMLSQDRPTVRFENTGQLSPPQASPQPSPRQPAAAQVVSRQEALPDGASPEVVLSGVAAPGLVQSDSFIDECPTAPVDLPIAQPSPPQNLPEPARPMISEAGHETAVVQPSGVKSNSSRGVWIGVMVGAVVLVVAAVVAVVIFGSSEPVSKDRGDKTAPRTVAKTGATPGAETATAAPAAAASKGKTGSPASGSSTVSAAEPAPAPTKVAAEKERDIGSPPRFVVTARVKQSKATCTLTLAGGEVQRGETPCRFHVPEGTEVTLAVQREGYEAFEEKWKVGSDRTLEIELRKPATGVAGATTAAPQTPSANTRAHRKGTVKKPGCRSRGCRCTGRGCRCTRSHCECRGKRCRCSGKTCKKKAKSVGDGIMDF